MTQGKRVALYRRDRFDRSTFARWEGPDEIRVAFWHPDRWIEDGTIVRATSRELSATPDELLEFVRGQLADRTDLDLDSLERVDPSWFGTGEDCTVLAYFRVIVP